MHDINGEAWNPTTLTAIRFGGVLLGMPKDQVTGVHLANDVQHDAPSPQDGWGNARIDSDLVRVYSLSEALVPMSPSESEAEDEAATVYCVVFSPTSSERFALTSSFVEQVPPEFSETVTPLPTAMRTDTTPIVGLVWYSGNILFTSTADRLADYLEAVSNQP